MTIGMMSMSDMRLEMGEIVSMKNGHLGQIVGEQVLMDDTECYIVKDLTTDEEILVAKE